MPSAHTLNSGWRGSGGLGLGPRGRLTGRRSSDSRFGGPVLEGSMVSKTLDPRQELPMSTEPSRTAGPAHDRGTDWNARKALWAGPQTSSPGAIYQRLASGSAAFLKRFPRETATGRRISAPVAVAPGRGPAEHLSVPANQIMTGRRLLLRITWRATGSCRRDLSPPRGPPKVPGMSPG